MRWGDNMKKFALGVVIVVLIVSISAVALASFTDTKIQVSFRDIKVVLNGDTIKTAFEPFIYNGHVYVSLKDIANIFNVPVSWDSENNAVVLGTPEKIYYKLSEIPFMKEKLEEQEDGSFINVGSSYNEVLSGIRFATIKGKVFKDSLLFAGMQEEYFKFNLNGKFTTFTFIAGATDDSLVANKDDYAVIKIYGDSKLLYTSPHLKVGSNAVFTSIPVKGVNVLTIDKELHGDSIVKVAIVNGELKMVKNEP